MPVVTIQTSNHLEPVKICATTDKPYTVMVGTTGKLGEFILVPSQEAAMFESLVRLPLSPPSNPQTPEI